MRRRRVLVGLCVLLVLTCSGLLLSVVQRVREVAARSKCSGNIYYVAFSLHNQTAFHGSFSGTVRLPAIPPERRLSWVVSVLPFAEQGTLFNRFSLSAPMDSDQNRAAGETPLVLFVCPMSVDHRWNESGERWVLVSNLTNYVGVAGVGADAAALPENHPRAGAFGYDRNTKLDGRTFSDGLSTTFLIVETAHELGAWAHGGWATVRSLDPEVIPAIGIGRPFGGLHAADDRPWRPRGASMNAIMADGSFRAIRSDIDPAVLEALATAAGKESLPAEW
jgi:hypothetical protein